MHMLHLLRHALATQRLQNGASLVGQALPATVGTLDLILCSSARRTRETMELVIAEFGARPRSVLEDELYEATKHELMSRLRRLPEDIGNVLLIGHNPGLHQLAMAIADTDSAGFRALSSVKYPTAARASFRVPGPWSAFGRSRCELVDYVTAESLRSDKD